MSEDCKTSNHCLFHQGRELKGFCRDCRTAVCFQCINNGCKGHQIDDELQQITMEEREGIDSELGRFKDEDIRKLGLRLEELEQEELQCDLAAAERRVKILLRAQCLKEEKDRVIDAAIAPLLQELEELHEIQRSKILKLRSRIHDMKVKSENRLQNWERTMHGRTDLSMLQIRPLLAEARNDISVIGASKELTTTESIDDNIEEVFKTLEAKFSEENNPNQSCRSEYSTYSDVVTVQDNAQVVIQFQVGDCHVHSMCSTYQNNAWVLESEKIMLLDNKGRPFQEHSLTSKVGSLAVNKDGEVLVTLPEKRVISKYNSKQGKSTVMFFETRNLIPCGIAICQNTGEILVGLVDRLDYSPTKDSERHVCCFHQDGHEKEKYSGCLGKKSVFIQPQKIAVCNNGIFAVINRLGQLKGEILIFKDGEICLKYPKEESKGEWFKKLSRVHFDPRDIDFDVLNHIITCDYESKHVILINYETGVAIRKFNCGSWPYSLTCFPNQKLWVGCAEGRIKVLNYLTYDS